MTVTNLTLQYRLTSAAKADVLWCFLLGCEELASRAACPDSAFTDLVLEVSG